MNKEQQQRAIAEDCWKMGRMRDWAFIVCLLSAVAARGAVITAASTSQADIETAIATAVSGDTVAIPAGTNSTYSGTTDVAKRITITGAGTNENSRTLLVNTQTRGFVGDEKAIFDVETGGVVISNIWLRGDMANLDNDGIHVNSGGANVIAKCVFEGFAWAQKWYVLDGLTYHSSFYSNDIVARVTGYATHAAVVALGKGNPPFGWTSTNFVVFEDCLFNLTNWNADTYMIDTEYAANYMVRHCTGGINRQSGVTVDGFDMHNSTSFTPLGPVIYANTWTYSGASAVDVKWTDIRGGANSLVYSNGVVAEDAYATMRDDPAIGVYMTNTFFFANTEKDGAYNASGSTPPTENTHFTNGAPAGFSVASVLAYPHPLRQLASLPSPTVTTLGVETLNSGSISKLPQICTTNSMTVTNVSFINTTVPTSANSLPAFTPASNATLIVFAVAGGGAGVTIDVLNTSGPSLTWWRVGQTNNGSFTYAVWLTQLAQGVTPSSTTVRIDLTAGGNGLEGHVHQITGADQTASWGTNAVVQFGIANLASSSTGTMTFSAPGNGDKNAILTGFCTQQFGANTVPQSPWIELLETSHSIPNDGLATAYRLTVPSSVTSFSQTNSGAVTWQGAFVEIKAKVVCN